MLPKSPATPDENGKDGFSRLSEIDSIIALHRRLTAAEQTLQRIIEEAAREVEAGQDDRPPPVVLRSRC